MNAHEQQAYDFGAEHARNAASWTLDGNASEAHYRKLLRGLEDGDIEVIEDGLPTMPDLSGEWASDMTPTRLYGKIIGYNAYGGIDDPDGELTAALCDAYEAGVADTFYDECERLLREALA